MKTQVLFVLPCGTDSRLTDDGWMFDSDAPMPEHVLRKMIEHFEVPLVEEYLGIRKFQNQQTEIHAVSRGDGSLGEISVRSNTAALSQRLRTLLADEAVEILDPETALS